MQKVKLKFDYKNFAAFNQQLLKAEVKTEEIVSTWNSLNIRPLKTEDLPMLLSNPKDFFLDAFSNGKRSEIGGIKIKTSEALRLIDLPKGFESLLFLIEGSGDYISQFLDFFIIKNDKLEINKVALDIRRETYNIYAETPGEIELCEALKSLADSLNNVYKLRGLFGAFKGSVQDHIDEMLTYDLEKFEINSNYVKEKAR